eukprot:TRINITY_DN3637_c0_g1_i1.p1 TRINITY_DN3637_c0_g1~~TRINITY_DN3637_c0_g1_i1.p1  ORF type:complete len:205 (+),score=19.69 TRINITY_DN3637_c0_g1_i1:342-956(+)
MVRGYYIHFNYLLPHFLQLKAFSFPRLSPPFNPIIEQAEGNLAGCCCCLFCHLVCCSVETNRHGQITPCPGVPEEQALPSSAVERFLLCAPTSSTYPAHRKRIHKTRIHVNTIIYTHSAYPHTNTLRLLLFKKKQQQSFAQICCCCHMEKGSGTPAISYHEGKGQCTKAISQMVRTLEGATTAAGTYKLSVINGWIVTSNGTDF